MKFRIAFSFAIGTLWCLSPCIMWAQSESSPAATQTSKVPFLTSDALPVTGPAAPEEPTEDWTTISLAHSGLPLALTGGVPISTVELPDCTRQLLRMEWRTGDPIDLYLIRPHGITKPPAILYLFNYTNDSNLFRSDSWCQQAKRTGIATVGFVSALAGQRFHSPRPMKQWFVSELQEALASSTHDVQMVLNYLTTRGDIDMEHIGIFGQGSGGSIAILAAAADPRISALELLDPWGDWPDWLKSSKAIPESERPNYLQAAFLDKVAGLDPANFLPQLKDRPIRIEQVTSYGFNPPEATEKIAAAAPHPNDVAEFSDFNALYKTWHSQDSAGWLGDQLHGMSRKENGESR